MRILCCVLLLFWSGSAFAQQEPIKPPPIGPTVNPETPEEKEPSPAGELFRKARLRMMIETESSDFLKLKNSAVRIQELADGLLKQVEATNAATISDPKPLREIEKLAKEVLNKSGGSKVEEEHPDLPKELSPACRLLAEYSNCITEDLKKGSRFVISANVVKYSNSLLTLVRYMQKHF